MINVYIGKENLPVGGKIVSDVESRFDLIWFTGDDIEKSVVKEIEKGEYVDTNTWIDRFGYKREPSDISNGSKTVICATKDTSSIYLGEEMGVNALDLFFREGSGNIYFPSKIDVDLDVNVLIIRKDLYVNGKEFVCEDDLEGFTC